MDDRIGVAVLGSTGSIGRQTLEVMELHKKRYQVVALAAWGGHLDLLQEQVDHFHPSLVAVGNPPDAHSFTAPSGVRLLAGTEGIVEVATHPRVKIVVAAMTGISSLTAVYEALKTGKRVALANKETLVAGGQVITLLVNEGLGELIPVDSEHSAIFQCLLGQRREDVTALWLTASGGPFWDMSSEELSRVTPQEALAHPVWNMGPKITVDSATLMNKGLEVIEACWLFSMKPSKVRVVIHPQGVVHSLVQFKDGAMLAQMGPPDMRIPIAYALGFPKRLKSGIVPLDLTQCPPLTFQTPDTRRFPLLALAYEALGMGGTAPAALNAANEVAVEAFLRGEISFTQLAMVVERVLERWKPSPADSIDAVKEADDEARRRARSIVDQLTGDLFARHLH